MPDKLDLKNQNQEQRAAQAPPRAKASNEPASPPSSFSLLGHSWARTGRRELVAQAIARLPWKRMKGENQEYEREKGMEGVDGDGLCEGEEICAGE